VFTARYALSPYIKQIGFVFKGLNVQFMWALNLAPDMEGRLLRLGLELDKRMLAHLRQLVPGPSLWSTGVDPKAVCGNCAQNGTRQGFQHVHLHFYLCVIIPLMLHTLLSFAGVGAVGQLKPAVPRHSFTRPNVHTSVISANTNLHTTVTCIALCSVEANILAGHFPALCPKNSLNARKLRGESYSSGCCLN
jgi:hypothetical protein